MSKKVQRKLPDSGKNQGKYAGIPLGMGFSSPGVARAPAPSPSLEAAQSQRRARVQKEYKGATR